MAISPGAGIAIGRATANLLVSEGGRLAAVPILDESLRTSLVDQLTGFAGEAFSLVADALDPDQVQATVRTGVGSLGSRGHSLSLNSVGGSAIMTKNRTKTTIEELVDRGMGSSA